MADFFENIFGLNRRSVRRTFQGRVTVDDRGEQIMAPTVGDAILHSEQGSIDRDTSLEGTAHGSRQTKVPRPPRMYIPFLDAGDDD